MQLLGIIESTHDDIAIRHYLIKTDSPWCPSNAFSLLRIVPEVSWQNLNDRPGRFSGRVDTEHEVQLNSG